MVKAFEIAGYGEKDVVERFAGTYRPPRPHGEGRGRRSHCDAALRHHNLREISLFPMNQQAVDLLMGAPSDVGTRSCANFTSG